MHFSQSGETHVIWHCGAHRGGPHDLALLIDGLRRCDTVNPHGPVALSFDLFDRTIKPHDSNPIRCRNQNSEISPIYTQSVAFSSIRCSADALSNPPVYTAQLY